MTDYRRIILTGGIGSGKTYVAGRLGAKGWAVIHADTIGHEILEPEGAAYDSVASRWPSVVVEGAIDRAHLATIVFGDPEQLRELEAITHPRIRETILERVDATQGKVVVEIPLLRDWFSGWPVVIVMAPLPVRRRRLHQRGMDDGDIDRRIASQPTEAQWRSAGDFVINNDEQMSLEPQLDALDQFLVGFSVTGDR